MVSGTESNSGNQTTLGVCLVTGGAGYLGTHLVRALVDRGERARALDIVPCPVDQPGVESIVGDVTRYDDVLAACEGVETIFHTAAIIDLRGLVTEAQRRRSFSVNVEGTRNVLRAAAETGVARVVYTSSNNVVFDREIVRGDETERYATRFFDLYTETKVTAEKEVLASDKPGGPRTAALRPGGIWGPGQDYFMPRMVRQVAAGFLKVVVGSLDAEADNTYVDNLVDAHVLAAEGLRDRPEVVGGQAYFITDGEPENAMVFFKPLVLDLGYKFPTRTIPAAPVYAFAYLAEFAHRYLGAPHPPMTRTEIRKVSISHSVRIDKAARDLGYHPKITTSEGLKRCLPHCQEILREYLNRERVDHPPWGWWVGVWGGLGLAGWLGLSTAAYGWWATHVTAAISQSAFRWAFVGVLGLHVLEGLFVYQKAKSNGLHATAAGWWAQTTLIGYPSTTRFLKRLRRRRT